MATIDLQSATNLLNRVLDKIKAESKSFSASILAVIIAVLALLMSWMAVYDSTHAKIQMQVVLESNVILVKEIRVLQNKIDRYEANLHALEDH